MTVAIVCVALLGFLVFALGLMVSATRGRTNRIIGHAADPTDPLHKLVRAHGNAAEYAPIIAILIWLVGSREPAAWMVWTFVAATACRYLHAVGMVAFESLARPNPVRFVGALGTYVTGLALVVAAFLRA